MSDPIETSDLDVIQQLIDAGILTENDVVEANPNKDRDNSSLATSLAR